MGRTGIYACGESVSRRNSLESVALFSLKQEAPASIGGSTFTVDSSNMKDVYYKPADMKQNQMDLFADNIKEDRLPALMKMLPKK